MDLWTTGVLLVLFRVSEITYWNTFPPQMKRLQPGELCHLDTQFYFAWASVSLYEKKKKKNRIALKDPKDFFRILCKMSFYCHFSHHSLGFVELTRITQLFVKEFLTSVSFPYIRSYQF